MGRDQKLAEAIRARMTQQGAARMGSGLIVPGHAVRPTVVDRMGAPVEVDDLVLYETPVTPVFQVKGLRTIAVPGGQMAELLIGTEFPIRLPIGHPVAQLVVVGMKAKAEAKDGDGAGPSAPGGGDGAESAAGGRGDGVGGDGQGRGAAPGDGPGGDAEGGERGQGGGVRLA